MSITFDGFQTENAERCRVGFGHEVDWKDRDWPLQNWCLAIAGEAGELCNLVKKILRGDFPYEEKRAEILKELADVICYCDLAMSACNANTGEEVQKKFEEVSRRIGYKKQ